MYFGFAWVCLYFCGAGSASGAHSIMSFVFVSKFQLCLCVLALLGFVFSRSERSEQSPLAYKFWIYLCFRGAIITNKTHSITSFVFVSKFWLCLDLFVL